MRVSPHVKCELWREISVQALWWQPVHPSGVLGVWKAGVSRGEQGSMERIQPHWESTITLGSKFCFHNRMHVWHYFFSYWKEKMKGFCFNSMFYCCAPTPANNDDTVIVTSHSWDWTCDEWLVPVFMTIVIQIEICKTEQGPLRTSSWNSEVWSFLLSLHKIKSYC